MNHQASNFFALSALNIRPWNVESLESTNNSPLALVQGVARATGECGKENCLNWSGNNFKQTRTEGKERLECEEIEK